MEISDDMSLSKVKVTHFFVKSSHLGFELIFFKGEISYSTALFVIISNNRTVPCMGLGARLHLSFWRSAIVF